MFKNIKIIDSHTHIYKLDSIQYLSQSALKYNFAKFCIMSLSCCGISHIMQNLLCAYAKMLHPGDIYAYGGLFYPEKSGPANSSDLLKQALRLSRLGFDGMKMLEGKPDIRKKVGLSLDSSIYDEYYSFLETEEIPITYHVGDPKVFWDNEKAPDWAKREGWVYTDGSFCTKEALYSEVAGFLRKFPRLKVTFAHFFFMGEEGIKRASEFLERWPNVNYDITPGIEMYGSFSEAPESWRDFFIKYQDRILFGTDNGMDESMVYIDVTRAFLETFDEFECRGMKIKGIGLEEDILKKIYHSNFERLAGKIPKKISKDILREECDQVTEIIKKDNCAKALLPGVRDILTRISEL